MTDDDDRYPMVPSHPRWDERSASTMRWQRAATVLFAVVSAGAAVVIAVRVLL